MATTVLTVNGQKHHTDADPATPLLWVLRDELQLTGTKFGCGMGMCGACTVHLAGKAVRSCLTPLSSVGSKAVITIEGLSKDCSHPVQRAWLEQDVAQCGYCQAGQIMTVAALIKEDPSESKVIQGLAGNLCRCGTYVRIRHAVRRAIELSRSRT